MSAKVLIVLPSYNLYGGTPKKTLDLIKFSKHHCFVYVWTNSYAEEFKPLFLDTKATIVEGNYGRNLLKHISAIIKIIDAHKIQIIHSQFFFGELLLGIVKILRPKLKVLIAFVGSLSPAGYRKLILKQVYKRADAFVYISNYVKREKINVFPVLERKNGYVIYNGTKNPIADLYLDVSKEKTFIFLAVSGLTVIKNIQVIIDAVKVLRKQGQDNIKVLVAGDGPLMTHFQSEIETYKLEPYIELLGYQKDVGKLLLSADAFLHPCYVEGFGIAVAEAMMAEKPIVGANTGALPELLENKVTGLTVDPFDANQWASAMLQLVMDKPLAMTLGKNAKAYAKRVFSVDAYVKNYDNLYKTLLK
ncbi:MAG: glycosyltransferase family 4 protein [Flavobacteriaceae bacterium]|nr:glycosyltransferase family 4 protein [Flavobacteriaceae bacterium]